MARENLSEYIANVELASGRAVPLWQLPVRRVQANRKPAQNKWWHAVLIGAIMATPFIVEILKCVF